jgi:hypothetical protein
MTSFTVRIELHDADWKDYDKLHTEMIGQGFVHTIESGDGIVYELPPAEYNFEGNLTKSEVLDRAKTAADRTNRKNAVLVTESNGRTWRGLSKA